MNSIPLTEGLPILLMALFGVAINWLFMVAAVVVGIRIAELLPRRNTTGQ
jgi:hypothetical protein